MVGFVAGFMAKKQSKKNLLEVIPTQLGIIGAVFVKKEFRNKGIGTKLINTIEKYLFDKKCNAIWINTNSFNLKALDLYKAAGYMAREVGLIKQKN